MVVLRSFRVGLVGKFSNCIRVAVLVSPPPSIAAAAAVANDRNHENTQMSQYQTFLFLAAIVTASCGCTTTRTSNTSRTGLEQMLISNAIDQALDNNQFTSLQGRAVLVQDKYLDCTDKLYIVASLRNRVLDAGGTLVEDAEKADVVLEVRSGGVGTDNTDRYVGVPGLAVPGMPIGSPGMEIGDEIEPYSSFAFTDRGDVRVFSGHGGLDARKE